MGDLDDDFGDIYADVETQANSAINDVLDFAQLHTEPPEEEEDGHDNNDNAKNANTCSGEGFVSDSKKPNSIQEELSEKVSGSEANDGYSESDSEDDLNIVLNDEGCRGIPFPNSGGGSMKLDDYEDEDEDAFGAMKEYKYVWTQGSTCPSNGKANESLDLVPSISFGGVHDYNMCNQRKGSSAQTSRVRDTPNPMVTRNRYGFRLPWYRTILDVDIESFEEKSWRNPGVDITDYFNFDLNEDSWKEYCNSLEQLRQLKSTQYGMPGSSKFYQVKEAVSEYGRFSQQTMSKEMNYSGSTFAHSSSIVSDCRPKGQAIQIEDSIFERQPSFDSSHPHSWNSDVVIQISVQETSNSGEEHGHTNSSGHLTSENGEFGSNKNQNNISYDTTSDDNSSLGTLEANTRKLDRCSQQISASHPMTIDSDNHRNNQVDVDGNNHKEVNGISSEAIGIANEVTESLDRTTSCADQCMMETQLSLGDDDQLSLISSCFASDSEASKNSVHFDPEDIHTPVKSLVNSHTEPSKSVTSSFKNSRSNGIKRQKVDVKDYSICRNSFQKERNYQDRRLNSVDEPSNHRNNDNDVSPTSDTLDLYDRNCSENFRRRKERLRDFGDSNREDMYYKERKFSCHNDIRYADNHDQNQRDTRNYLSRKGSHQFQEKRDPYVKRTFNERGSFCEDMDADWNHFGRTQFTEACSPLTSREARGLHSRYSSTVEERDAVWRRNSNKLLFKKIPSYNDCCFDYKCEDDYLGEKAGRCASFTDRKRNNLDAFDERQLPHVGRELNNWGRRGGYVDSPIYLDDSHSGKFEDEYCKHRENQYLSPHSYRELYTADEGSWNHSISPRNDVSYTSTADERYWRQVRKIDAEEANEMNWFDDHYDAYEIEDKIYLNEDLRWRRSNWRSEVMHWTEDQLTFRHHGDELYSERASRSYRKYVRHEKIHAKHGPLRNGMPIGNTQSDQYGLRMPRKVIGGNFINRSAKMYGSKHEHTVRCRDSMDLAVRERKTSARCSKARTLICNGRPENTGAEMGGKLTTKVNSQSSDSEKTRAVEGTQKVGWDRNNEKGHHMFPVTAQNADLDLEEGQIVTQEPNTEHPSQRKHAAGCAAPAHSTKKRMFDCHNASNGNMIVERYDKQRILQTMAKMEQRGERFKEPVTLKKEPDKSSRPEVDSTVETADKKQHRPARKRRWGGRFSKNDPLMLGIPLKARFCKKHLLTC